MPPLETLPPSPPEIRVGEYFTSGLFCLQRKHLAYEYFVTFCFSWGRESSVGIATRYGLDGPGIEFRWGRDFQHPSGPALGPTQPPVRWVPGLSWG